MIAGRNGEACILLYGEIGRWDEDIRSGDIVRELLELEAAYDRIDVRINSMGGEVYAGMAIFNALRNSKADITIYIDGIAASMASVIASARRPVYMSKYARLMIHSVQGGAYGSKDELQAAIAEMITLEDSLQDIYAERAGRTKDEIKTLFFDGKDHWLTAAEALGMNLIDGIYDTDPVPEDSTPDEVFTIYQNRLKPNNMLTDLLRKRPSFAMLATDEAILAFIENLETEAGKVPALQGRVTELTGRLQTYQTAEAEARKAEINALLDAAVTDGRIREPQRAVYNALLEKDFANTKEALTALQPARKVAVDLDNPPVSEGSFWDQRMGDIRNKLNK